MVSGKNASFSIDFVNEGFVLQRLSAKINNADADIELKYETTAIDALDSYEKCVNKLEDHTADVLKTNGLKKAVGTLVSITAMSISRISRVILSVASSV